MCTIPIIMKYPMSSTVATEQNAYNFKLIFNYQYIAGRKNMQN